MKRYKSLWLLLDETGEDSRVYKTRESARIVKKWVAFGSPRKIVQIRLTKLKYESLTALAKNSELIVLYTPEYKTYHLFTHQQQANWFVRSMQCFYPSIKYEQSSAYYKA